MKKAILFGVNEYDTQKDLRGCINDVEEMDALLNNVFHFDEVKKETNADVSKTVVADSIRQVLTPDAGENDGVRVIFFAGHGGRVFDAANGDEPDKVDETLCMPEYDWSNENTYLLDDDFAVLLQEAHEAAPFLRIYVVLDSCHSGTATRDISTTWDEIDLVANNVFGLESVKNHGWLVDDPRVSLFAVSRQADESPDIEQNLATSNSGNIGYTSMGHETGGGEPTSHLLLSGCAASQTCKDAPLDGDYHGVFTYALTRLIESNPHATWEAVHSSVSITIAAGFRQDPQLEGPAHLKQRPVFS